MGHFHGKYNIQAENLTDEFLFPFVTLLDFSSARVVSGRQCPPSGVGEDFLARRTGPLTKTAITRKQQVAK